jgi:hypothetical protein
MDTQGAAPNTNEKPKEKDPALSFGEITEKNLGQLKTLNMTVLPVRYHDKFYSDLLKSSEYCQLGDLTC